MKRRVVVTGMGAITPVGNDVAATWAAICAGKPGGAEITKFDHSTFPVHFAAEVKGFDPLMYLERKEAKRADLFAQYAIAGAMSVGVVDALEVIDVPDGEAGRLLEALPAFDLFGDALVVRETVRDLRELIDRRLALLVLQLVLQSARFAFECLDALTQFVVARAHLG